VLSPANEAIGVAMPRDESGRSIDFTMPLNTSIFSASSMLTAKACRRIYAQAYLWFDLAASRAPNAPFAI
jgi:hypothetical protein